jgi:WD40 repeat protein
MCGTLLEDRNRNARVTPDGQTVFEYVSSGRLGDNDPTTLRIWDLPSGQTLRELPEWQPITPGLTGNLSVTPDGHTAISISGDLTVRVWDLASGFLSQPDTDTPSV